MQTRNKFILFGAIVALVVIVLLATLPIAFGSGWGILYHSECVPGKTLAAELVWTPIILLNSPYDGNATGTAVQSYATGTNSETIRAYNGTAEALLALGNWTISSSAIGYFFGPGSNTRCNSQYVAEFSPRNYGEATGNIISANATSDFGEPNLAGSNPDFLSSPQARFANSYTTDNKGSFSACDASLGNGSLVGFGGKSTSYSVQVPYNKDGNTFWINASVQSTVYYSWDFLLGGTWLMDNLSSGVSANTYGQTAFSYVPCA